MRVPMKPLEKDLEKAARPSNEQRYFDMLKRITLYQSPDRLRRTHEKEWGMTYPDALEMAYENILSDAQRAIRGKRRPAR